MDRDEIRQRLKERKMTQVRLAELLGIEPNKVAKILSGVRKPTVAEMDVIRQVLGHEQDAQPQFRTIPIIGQVVAGNWRAAIQHTTSYMPQPDPSTPPHAFALRVTGDSMDLYVEDGGNVVIDPDDKALYPGRFYVILNGEGETTFKRFQADPARLVPCSTNSAHQEILIGEGPFEIVGRVIWRASRM